MVECREVAGRTHKEKQRESVCGEERRITLTRNSFLLCRCILLPREETNKKKNRNRSRRAKETGTREMKKATETPQLSQKQNAMHNSAPHQNSTKASTVAGWISTDAKKVCEFPCGLGRRPQRNRCSAHVGSLCFATSAVVSRTKGRPGSKKIEKENRARNDTLEHSDQKKESRSRK